MKAKEDLKLRTFSYLKAFWVDAPPKFNGGG